MPDFRQKYYHMDRHIWRLRFANRKGMNLRPRNKTKFSVIEEATVSGHIAVSPQKENNEWMKNIQVYNYQAHSRQ